MAEAFELLERLGEDAKILAGGQSLIPLMKLRLVSPRYIVDLNKIPELSYIAQADGGFLKLGGMTRYNEMESSDVVAGRVPMLKEACSVVADMHVRNMGTLGGNLCHADPSADLPPVFLALEGEAVIQSAKGIRTVAAERFFEGLFLTCVTQGEVLTEVRIPPIVPRTGSAYLKFSRVEGDFAIVSVAALWTAGRDHSCEGVRIALGGVNEVPIAPADVERMLAGTHPEERHLLEAAEKAAEQCDPWPDLRGSAEYKRKMARVFTRRALELARARAEAIGVT